MWLNNTGILRLPMSMHLVIWKEKKFYGSNYRKETAKKAMFVFGTQRWWSSPLACLGIG
jgi:hypothetical protein